MTAEQSGSKVDTNRTEQATIDTRHLFQGRKELIISHDGVCYTLRITSNNKLILTK